MFKTGALRVPLKACTLIPRAASHRLLLTKAYDSGPRVPPLLTLTVPGHFDTIVEKHGARMAVVSRHQGRRLTYGELWEESNKLASGLGKLGVRKGDRVAVSMGNSLEYAVVCIPLH
jgi:non-ribosomal peptide synthetase component F